MRFRPRTNPQLRHLASAASGGLMLMARVTRVLAGAKGAANRKRGGTAADDAQARADEARRELDARIERGEKPGP